MQQQAFPDGLPELKVDRRSHPPQQMRVDLARAELIRSRIGSERSGQKNPTCLKAALPKKDLRCHLS